MSLGLALRITGAIRRGPSFTKGFGGQGQYLKVLHSKKSQILAFWHGREKYRKQGILGNTEVWG